MRPRMHCVLPRTDRAVMWSRKQIPFVGLCGAVVEAVYMNFPYPSVFVLVLKDGRFVPIGTWSPVRADNPTGTIVRLDCARTTMLGGQGPLTLCTLSLDSGGELVFLSDGKRVENGKVVPSKEGLDNPLGFDVYEEPHEVFWPRTEWKAIECFDTRTHYPQFSSPDIVLSETVNVFQL